MSALPPPPLRLSLMIWGLGAMLYHIGFYQRVAPAVLTTELTLEFSLSATALGNLSAFYFYSYVVMQVPTGLLADHWGPRKLLTMGACLAAIGGAVFAMAPGVGWANFGRLLIGGSVAVAFVGMLKLTGHWLPGRYYALASGMALLVGILGAVFAGVPLRLLVDIFDWRLVMLGSAMGTFAWALVIWWLVRDDPSERGYASYAIPHDTEDDRANQGVLSTILTLFRDPNIWLFFLIPGGVVGCILTFSGLWGVPYLTTRYGLSKTEAAAVCSALLVAWAIGGPLFGWLSDHVGRRKPIYLLGCLVPLLGWAFVLLSTNLSLRSLIALLFVASFFSGGTIVGFAFARESAPIRLSGTVSGVVNMGVMMGPMLMQPVVGWALDRHGADFVAGGIQIYSIDAYHDAFILMLFWLAVSTFLVFFTQETYCRQYSLHSTPEGVSIPRQSRGILTGNAGK